MCIVCVLVLQDKKIDNIALLKKKDFNRKKCLKLLSLWGYQLFRIIQTMDRWLDR